EKWRGGCAGCSGGGKGVGDVGALLAKNGCRIAGIYMTGANEDHLSDGYARIQPGPNFLNTPIYISAGHDDRIATVEQQYNVAGFHQAKRVQSNANRDFTRRGRSECRGKYSC